MNIGERVFQVLYLRRGPGAHPDIMMRRMRDGGGVSKVAYGVKALVLAGEGVEFGHERRDIADHFGTYSGHRWMSAAAKHVVLCIFVPT